MKIFTIIVFGLATIRTITPFMKDSTYRTLPKFLANFLLAGTMIWAYIWFLQYLLD